jgi:hypothetical protein
MSDPSMPQWYLEIWALLVAGDWQFWSRIVGAVVSFIIGVIAAFMTRKLWRGRRFVLRSLRSSRA